MNRRQDREEWQRHHDRTDRIMDVAIFGILIVCVAAYFYWGR